MYHPGPSGTLLLDAEKVLATVQSLNARIEERFPDSSLLHVGQSFQAICARSKKGIDWISRPIWPLHVVRYLLLGAVIAGLVLMVIGLRNHLRPTDYSIIDIIQTLEAGLNDVILIGVAVFFIWTLESRIKARRALRALHELRSIAHVIDMHQLTKDPYRLQNDRQDTASSPQMQLNSHDLKRYLDYCSEMLSLTSKVAALHLQRLEDPTVVAAVNEIEELTSGLSRKIWQKIDLVDRCP